MAEKRVSSFTMKCRLGAAWLALSSSLGFSGAAPGARDEDAPPPKEPARPGEVAMRPDPPAGQASADERRFVELINAERRRLKLREFAGDAALSTAARSHSEEMRELGFFGHISPTPNRRTPLDRFLLIRRGPPPDGLALGENVYYSDRRSVEEAHRGLWESPPHRGNITHDEFTRVGVGVAIGPRRGYWVTQMFATWNDPLTAVR
jgi:uncharacterized protein YkwD